MSRVSRAIFRDDILVNSENPDFGARRKIGHEAAARKNIPANFVVSDSDLDFPADTPNADEIHRAFKCHPGTAFPLNSGGGTFPTAAGGGPLLKTRTSRDESPTNSRLPSSDVT